MSNYGDPEYWEKRYAEQQGTYFDWLEDYSSLQHVIKPLITQESKILILGCGNAKFSEDMYLDGYHNIDNIDISQVVINQMAENNQDKEGMTWTKMDVTDLKYESNTYDFAVDKSTIDALLCGDDSFLNVAKMTREVQRVLKVGGYYMAISYGSPSQRLDHFNWAHLSWDVTHQGVGPQEPDGTYGHWVYLCRKKEDAQQVCDANWNQVCEELAEDFDEDLQDS